MIKCPLTPEQRQHFFITWLDEKEKKIRDRRCKGKENWIEWDLPLNTEEQKEMEAFEKKMKVEVSFGNFLEDSDV